MISVEEATTIIQEFVIEFEIEHVPISDSINRILATNISATRNYPPFNRVAMDGICINYNDYALGQRTFRSRGLQAAGSPPLTLSEKHSCLEIMTGAMISNGADTVIPYEQTERHGDDFIVKKDDVKKGANVHKKGIDTSLSVILLKPYTRIEAHTIAILATEGIDKVPVYKMPSVAVVSTGDELVPINKNPEPYQIRSSNNYMLQAALKRLNINAMLIHINDNKPSMFEKLSEVIEKFDILIMSGGVSKGKLDYVPEILNELGVEKKFHRIAQRPGKPFWFGSKGKKLVFALPGNPASSLLCFKKYFESWLMLCLRQEPNIIKVKLRNSYTFNPQLVYFAQAKLIKNQNGYVVDIFTGNGSGDLANFASIDGFVELPSDINFHKSENLYNFYKI